MLGNISQPRGPQREGEKKKVENRVHAPLFHFIRQYLETKDASLCFDCGCDVLGVLGIENLGFQTFYSYEIALCAVF